jgi:outer membrane protein assembly factor BamA
MGARTSRVVVFLGVFFISNFCGYRNGWAQSDDSDKQSDKQDNALNCAESTCRSAPTREKITAFGTGYVRGLFGGLEQGAGMSGGVQFTSREKIQNLELRANFIGSTRLDRRVDFEALVPRVGSSKNHIDAWFSYVNRDTKFFGIGPRLPRNFVTDFTAEQRSWQVSFHRDIANHVQGGVYTQIIDVHTSLGRRTRYPDIDVFFSPDPNGPISLWVPGLFSSSRILSNGGYVLYDTRNNLDGLTKGFQFLARAGSYDGLNNHNAFADYGWNETEVDVRGYIPLGSPQTSLALRSRGQLKRPKGGSQIPFYDLSWLGGREYVRGFNSYRYRANNVLMYSVELRQTIIAQSPTRGFDVIGFADTGQVWGDSRSLIDPVILENRHLDRSNWHSGVGGAFEYRRSSKLVGRIDVSHSNEGYFVYATLSRGF